MAKNAESMDQIALFAKKTSAFRRMFFSSFLFHPSTFHHPSPNTGKRMRNKNKRRRENPESEDPPSSGNPNNRDNRDAPLRPSSAPVIFIRDHQVERSLIKKLAAAAAEVTKLKAEAKVLGSQARALERSLELVAEANSPDGINCGETEFVEVTSITGGGGGLVSDQTVHRASAMAYDKKVMEDARTVTVSEDTSTGGINITTVVTVLPGVALPLPRGDFSLLTSLCREEQLQGHLLEELHRAVRLRERSEAVAREVNGRRRKSWEARESEDMFLRLDDHLYNLYCLESLSDDSAPIRAALSKEHRSFLEEERSRRQATETLLVGWEGEIAAFRVAAFEASVRGAVGGGGDGTENDVDAMWDKLEFEHLRKTCKEILERVARESE